MILMFFTRGKSREGVPDDEMQRLQAAHIENLRRLYFAGVGALAGPLQDPSGFRRGIVLLRVDDPQDVPAHFATDPYVSQGFMGVESHPVTPTRLELGEPDLTAIAEHTIAFIEGDGPHNTLPDFSQLLHLPEKPSVILQRRRDTTEGSLGALALFATSQQNDVRTLLENQFSELHPGGSWTLHVWKQWLSKGVLA